MSLTSSGVRMWVMFERAKEQLKFAQAAGAG